MGENQFGGGGGEKKRRKKRKRKERKRKEKEKKKHCVGEKKEKGEREIEDFPGVVMVGAR